MKKQPKTVYLIWMYAATNYPDNNGPNPFRDKKTEHVMMGVYARYEAARELALLEAKKHCSDNDMKMTEFADPGEDGAMHFSVFVKENVANANGPIVIERNYFVQPEFVFGSEEED